MGIVTWIVFGLATALLVRVVLPRLEHVPVGLGAAFGAVAGLAGALLTTAVAGDSLTVENGTGVLGSVVGAAAALSAAGAVIGRPGGMKRAAD